MTMRVEGLCRRMGRGAGAVLLGTCLAGVARAAEPVVPTPPRLLLVAGIDAPDELRFPTYQNVTRLPGRPEDKPTGSSYKTLASVTLRGVVILGVDGKPVSLADARKRLVQEASILVTSKGQKPAPVYLRAVARDALIFVFPNDAPAFTPAQWPIEQPAGGGQP
jgi:hypothetical protein